MKRFKDEKGQALVEAALVLTVLLLVVMGIFDFGWLMYHKIQIENCAREGARHAAVYYDINNTAASDLEVIDVVNANAPSSTPLAVTVTVSGDGVHVNNYLTVTVKGEVEVMTPLIRPFFSGGVCEMEATTVSYREPAAMNKK